jgi:spermidine synthase
MSRPATDRTVTPASRLLVPLAFCSGVCGLAYEALYTRLLTTYLGDMLHVAGAVLATFLVGIGIGSLLARRLHPWLWALEAAIGFYGVAVAFATPLLSHDLLARVLPATSSSSAATTLAVAIVLATPSILIGTSVPLFSHYLENATNGESGEGFDRVYMLYNAGAAACPLVVEFVLLPRLGLQATILCTGALNLMTGLALRVAALRPPVPPAAPVLTGDTKLTSGVLFAVSALSSLYQLLALRLVDTFFGPFHENFSLLLSFVMVGIGVGTMIAHRSRSSFSSWLLIGALVLALSFGTIDEMARLWSHASSWAGDSAPARWIAKASVLGLLTLPAFTVFGGTVPAALRAAPQAGAGAMLAVSSFGNCLGYLAAVLVLLERAPEAGLLAAILVGVFGAGLLLGGLTLRKRVAWTVAAAGAIAAVTLRFPNRYLAFDYSDFLAPASLEKSERELLTVERIKRLDGAVSIIGTRSGTEVVTINGYTSLASSTGGRTNPHEVLVGLMPALYAPRRGHALVLGTGTGITAGTTAVMFDRITAVEINPAVAAALPHFSAFNFGLATRPNVRLVLQDGLSVIASSRERYDAIISTVTSPIYFASHKLYAREFFDLVKARLVPGGVFTFWFDARLPMHGVRVLLQTISESFHACDFVFLTKEYFDVVCGDRIAPAAIDENALPQPIRDVLAPLAGGLGVTRLLDALILRPSRFENVTFADEVNTFDRPLLEQIMARQPLMFRRKPWVLDPLLGFQLEAAALGTGPFTATAFADRCQVFAAVGASAPPPSCQAAIADPNATDFRSRLADLAVATARPEIRRALSGHQVIASLLAKGRLDDARAYLQSMRSTYGRNVAYEVERLSTDLAVLGDVSDDALSVLAAHGPLSDAVRRLIISVALKRNRKDLAIEHLLVLSRQAGLTEADQALLGRLRKAPGAAPASGQP